MIKKTQKGVTILILVDGFLQSVGFKRGLGVKMGHNPYFSRWFSAINTQISSQYVEESHNPYFSRWFSAITRYFKAKNHDNCHNPYFSRWFSAIAYKNCNKMFVELSQSLF